MLQWLSDTVRTCVISACALTAFAALPVSAAESNVVQTSRSTSSLITALNEVTRGQPFGAALRLRLAPGWHVYWINPGEAGLPPSLTVTGLPGAEVTPLQWPLPHRAVEGTLTTFAYTGDVVLPFTLTPGGAPLAVDAQAEWLVCRDVCVPESASFHLTLPAGAAADVPATALIGEAIARVPQPAPFAASLTPAGQLTLAGVAAPQTVRVGYYPLTDGVVTGADDLRPSRSGEDVTVQLGPASKAGPGVVALTDAAGHTTAHTIQPVIAAQPRETGPSLPLLLLSALMGGLLLNLMPCVFPILAMKAVGLVRLSGQAQRRLRWEAASYTAGVIASFMTAGLLLMALRGAGQDVGWGFQMQSPLFVAGMSWVLFAVGLNLVGAFPLAGFASAGSAASGRHGHVASFVTGALAVLVASPCTAPFMATALAGATLLPAWSVLLVFIALGAGLALPYALIAAVPRLSSLLPRPGAWMQILQQALAFPMFAAVVWLVWVISQQTGASGVLLSAAGLLAVALAGWAWNLARIVSRGPARVARGIAAVGLLALPALLYDATRAPSSDPAEPFTPARLEQLRAEGRPVFVDLTAAWCLSCLVNERVALMPEAVKTAFADHGVAFLRGDWTTRSPVISSYLAGLGREGVPVYVLYPPGMPGEILPEVLTPGLVLRELAKLDRKPPAPAG